MDKKQIEKEICECERGWLIDEGNGWYVCHICGAEYQN
jgi:hypothetical protein